jgi:hypothetical protein
MPRYVIERDIPEIGSSNQNELRESAGKSNDALASMKEKKKNVQWEHSYIADNKTFCIYIADNEDLVREHAELSGFPATIITQVSHMIDPVTAEA